MNEKKEEKQPMVNDEGIITKPFEKGKDNELEYLGRAMKELAENKTKKQKEDEEKKLKEEAVSGLSFFREQIAGDTDTKLKPYDERLKKIEGEFENLKKLIELAKAQGKATKITEENDDPKQKMKKMFAGFNLLP